MRGKRKKRSHFLSGFYYAILVGVIILLAVSIKKESKSIAREGLLQGEFPEQAKNLNPVKRAFPIPEDIGEKEVLFGINPAPSVEEAEIKWELTNPAESNYIIHMELMTKDGEAIASSGAVPPGSCQEKVPLSRKLSGKKEKSLPCVGYVFVYDSLRFSYCGVFTVPVELQL